MPIGPNGEQLPYPEDFQQAGLPPELAAVLGGMGSVPAQATNAPPPEAAPRSGPDILRQMLSLAAEYADSEDDDDDLLQIEQARTLLQRILAKQQKQQEAALGTSPALKGLARASRG